MRIGSISSGEQGYAKKQVMSQSANARQNKENYNNISQPSFRGNYGAGVGSACGEAAVAWLGGAALVAMGPLALIGDMFAGFLGGAVAGHVVEEALSSDNNSNNND